MSGFSPIAAAVILGVQAVVFAIGAARGPRRHPYGLVFATFVAPRLGPVTEREPVPPLKFAQFVGFVFAVVGVVGFAVGVPLAGPDRHRLRARRGLPQRGLRHLPGLPALPARRPTAPYSHPRINLKHQATERISYMARSDVLVTRTGPRAISTRRTPSSSRSTRTPAPTTAATSPARSSWTGAPICRTPSSATSSTPSSSPSCFPTAASPTTTP